EEAKDGEICPEGPKETLVEAIEEREVRNESEDYGETKTQAKNGSATGILECRAAIVPKSDADANDDGSTNNEMFINPCALLLGTEQRDKEDEKNEAVNVKGDSVEEDPINST